MKKLVLLALVFALVLAACSNWNVEIREPEPPSVDPIPEWLNSALDEKQDFDIIRQVDCSIMRTDAGIERWFSGGYYAVRVLDMVKSLDLRSAKKGETAEYYLKYPFEVRFSYEGEEAVYTLSENSIEFNGNAMIPQNPEALKDYELDPNRSNMLYGAVSGELMLFGEALPFKPEEVSKLTVTNYDIEVVNDAISGIVSEDTVYEGKAAENYIKDFTEKPVRKYNMDLDMRSINMPIDVTEKWVCVFPEGSAEISFGGDILLNGEPWLSFYRTYEWNKVEE